VCGVAVANEAESRRWNDPEWIASWTEREKLTSAVSPTLLAAVGAVGGERVCDVGCGGGELTIALGDAVGPEGSVVGLDISAPLLSLARDRAAAAGQRNVRFVEMDVQTGSGEDGPFDVVVSQFGVMFFDEPTVAFGAIRRRLGARGRFVFACWQDVERNPWHTRSMLRALLPAPVTPPVGKSPVGPFVLGDDEYVRDLLGGAGFGAVSCEEHSMTVRGQASAVADTSQLVFIGVPEDREAEARELVERHLTRFAVVGAGEDVYEYPLAFRIYEARLA
jgi:SAM-dependent methyltransferase